MLQSYGVVQAASGWLQCMLWLSALFPHAQFLHTSFTCVCALLGMKSTSLEA